MCHERGLHRHQQSGHIQCVGYWPPRGAGYVRHSLHVHHTCHIIRKPDRWTIRGFVFEYNRSCRGRSILACCAIAYLSVVLHAFCRCCRSIQLYSPIGRDDQQWLGFVLIGRVHILKYYWQSCNRDVAFGNPMDCDLYRRRVGVELI